MQKRHSQDVPLQCGIGGCRAPEAPNPFSLPAPEFLWDESPRKESVRKQKVPDYRYAS